MANDVHIVTACFFSWALTFQLARALAFLARLGSSFLDSCVLSLVRGQRTEEAHARDLTARLWHAKKKCYA